MSPVLSVTSIAIISKVLIMVHINILCLSKIKLLKMIRVCKQVWKELQSPNTLVNHVSGNDIKETADTYKVNAYYEAC